MTIHKRKKIFKDEKWHFINEVNIYRQTDIYIKTRDVQESHKNWLQCWMLLQLSFDLHLLKNTEYY